MDDLISRQAAISTAITAAIDWHRLANPQYSIAYCIGEAIRKLPSAQPTLYGYDIEHLELIANILQKENLPPERITEVLTDTGRIVAMVRDEFEETLRKAVKRCTI